MARQNRTRKDSAQAQIKAFKNSNTEVPLPEGVELRDESEHLIWNQFARARARDDWRTMDLILLAKVVRAEASIRRHQETLDKSGVIIKNDRGTLVENPMMRVVETLQRQQLSIIRAMSLNTTPTDPRTVADNAKAQADAGKVADKRDGVMSLLARPN